MLTFAFDEFTAQRPKDRKRGFIWEERSDDLHLIHMPGCSFETYEPAPGLYREFASLPADPDAVLRFVNKYGPEAVKCEEIEFNADEVVYNASRFKRDWLPQISEMGHMVDLADAIQDGELKAMRKAVASLLPYWRTEALPGWQEQVQGMTANEVATAAVRRLYASPRKPSEYDLSATWNQTRKSVQVGLVFPHRGIAPGSLRDFMSGQLFLSLLSGRKYQRCTTCDKWFQLAPGVGRADKTACSDSCRFMAYRRRRQRALELHAEGWSIKRIAKEIGSDVGKVKEWVSKHLAGG
jgi:hypothetical protein